MMQISFLFEHKQFFSFENICEQIYDSLAKRKRITTQNKRIPTFIFQIIFRATFAIAAIVPERKHVKWKFQKIQQRTPPFDTKTLINTTTIDCERIFSTKIARLKNNRLFRAEEAPAYYIAVDGLLFSYYSCFLYSFFFLEFVLRSLWK